MKRNLNANKSQDPKAYRKELYALEKKETKRVNLTLKIKEYERLKSEAQRAGITPTKYAHIALMSTVDERMKKYMPAPATITMLMQSMLPITRNFNQLVRKANALGVHHGDLMKANIQLQMMRKMVDESFANAVTMENRIVAYLYRDPDALRELESIINNFKAEKGLL